MDVNYGGEHLGNYLLEDEIGRGGMGVVYRATHELTARTFAIKVLPQGGDSKALKDRFLREISILTALEHPNIVGLHDASGQDGVLYFVMEFVQGRNVAELIEAIRKSGQVPIPLAREVIRQTALGLQHIYSQNLVHRDIKPSNLMLNGSGVVKILDLGLARIVESMREGELTLTGQVMGTPDYMAPEQRSDASTATIRADIYSLGCTLFHLLAGRAPYADAAGGLVSSMRTVKPRCPASVSSAPIAPDR